MTWALRTPLLLQARAWRVGPVLLAAAAAFVAWYVVPSGPVRVPAAEGASSLLWPLLPCLVAAAVPAFLSGADESLARTAAVGAVRLRLRGLAVAAVLCAIAAAPGAWRFDAVVVSRNSALLTGLAVGSAVCLPSGAAWLPVTLVPIVTWLLGTDAATRRLHPWAVLLEPRASIVAVGIACGALLVGAVAYLARPRLTSGWWTRARRPRPA